MCLLSLSDATTNEIYLIITHSCLGPEDPKSSFQQVSLLSLVGYLFIILYRFIYFFCYYTL